MEPGLGMKGVGGRLISCSVGGACGSSCKFFVAERGARPPAATTCLPADSCWPVMRAPGREPQGALGPPTPGHPLAGHSHTAERMQVREALGSGWLG